MVVLEYSVLEANPLRNQIWQDIRDAAGLRGVRMHDLPHTFASHAAMNKET